MGETAKRLISGFAIAGVFIFCITYQGMYMFPLFIFTLAFALVGVSEFYKLAGAKIKQTIPATLGYFSTAVFMGFVYIAWQINFYVPGAPLYHESVKKVLSLLRSNYQLMSGLLFMFLIVLLKVQLLRNKVENSLHILSIYVLSMVYLPFTFSHLFLLYTLENGLFYIWMVVWATAMSDAGGYFMGRAFGKHKVGFAVSPNKTYEGYILGCFLQMALVVIFYHVARSNFNVPAYSYAEMAAFGFVIYLASVLGDLSESMIKRDAGIKDSGSLIPGHGGVLDLLDAILITIPSSYYFFYIVQEFRRL